MSKTIIRGYKYKIYPTEEQKSQLDKFINLYRYVYNWAINLEKESYELYKQNLTDKSFYNFFDLCQKFKEFRDQSKNEWLKEIPNTTARLALRDAIQAYKSFFNKLNGFPKFKSKKKSSKFFKTRNDRFRILGDNIKVEGINTTIDLHFNCGFNSTDIDNKTIKFIQPSISKDNFGDYFVSFSIEEESKILEIEKSDVIGIDLGIRQTFALSTGEVFTQPNEKINKLEHRRRKIQRHITRDINHRLEESMHTKTKYEDIPKSKRSIKRENRLRKIYTKIHNIKETYYHTITKQIVMRNPKAVIMETFKVKQITKNKKYMAKQLVQVSFYDITQKMKYKCQMYNIPFKQADINYPSSQICSCCGSRKRIWSKKVYKCKVCGNIIDRDINAAINLKNLYYTI